MRTDLNIEDLENILQWHSIAFQNNEDTGEHGITLIKIQAMMIYAREEEERQTNFLRRRMR